MNKMLIRCGRKGFYVRPIKPEEWYFPSVDFKVRGVYKGFNVTQKEDCLVLEPAEVQRSLVWLHPGDNEDVAVDWLTEFKDFPPDVRI